MAKRKKKTVQKKNSSNIDISLIFTFIISILLSVFIYTNSGFVGEKINEILGGMLGLLKYVFPIGSFIVSVKVAFNKNEDLQTKIIQYCAFIMCVAIVVNVYEISSGKLAINTEISQIVKKAYELGINDVGGGALGALGAVPLVNMFGKFGAVILSILISIVLFAFTFGIDIVSALGQGFETIKEENEEKKEERAQRRELRKQEKIQYREEQAQIRQDRQKDSKKSTRDEIRQANPFVEEENQIKINLNGRILDETNEKNLKKYKHEKDDLVPLGMKEQKEDKEENKKEIIEPDFIEENLFREEEEKKETNKKAVLQLEHALTVEEDENYEYPPVEILSKGEKKSIKGGAKALTDTATKLQKTLYSFGVSAKVENVSVGPAITRYELKPADGVRVSKIAKLSDDIALNLAAETIRIEAPIPGKQAVGIEIPNKEKEAVHLREVIESDEFQNNDSKLSVALGKDVAGNTMIADIAKMPHVLIAGSTGSGKSVCINTIITSILYNSKPSEVKLVMVDPKVVELSVYNGIPHLLIPVVTEPKKAAGALAWAVQEMENRYSVFAQKGVRDLKGYNAAVEKEEGGKLPQIVIIIDELADLMMVAAKDVEDAICRLAQKARAAGMHLVIATQRPSVDVITGIIKANVPSRIAFAVSSQIDSRTILDSAGAEKLLGKGDMLFYPSGSPKPMRVQGAFVSDGEVEKIVDFIKSNGEAVYSEDIIESIENNNKTDKEVHDEMENDEDEADPFLSEAIDVVVETGQASTSFIQRRFKVGYARAGRIIDQMEERGVISGYQGSKPRQVLMTLEKLNELKMEKVEK